MIKKIILLALTILVMVGCAENENKKESCNTMCVVIDSCEYIVNTEKYAYAYTEHNYTTYSHKGNCHFCKERDSIKWEKCKNELKELVIKLNRK